MRIFIVDDDDQARSALVRLLKEIPDAEIIGEASGGAEALSRLQEDMPDVLFLEADLSGMSSFELLQGMGAQRPAVIFVAKTEAFAARAFRVNATDYLLKPLDPELLAAALGKLEPSSPAKAGNGAQASCLLRAKDRVFVRDGSRCWFVPVGGIRLLESEGNYTRLYIGSDKPLVYGALKSFQARLDPGHFFRANRTQIINLDNIERVSLGENDELVAYLNDGSEVSMSRRMAQQFRDQLGL